MFIITFLVVFLLTGGNSVSFTILNKCHYQIWPATLTSGGPAISNTGFTLNPGASNQLDVAKAWSGRIWARTHCSSDSASHFKCLVGDCGTDQISCNGKGGNPPVTLVEMTLNGNGVNKDTYDVSLVDGFNIPISVEPAGRGCTTTSCKADVNTACPTNLAIKDPSSTVIACKSTCLATHDPKYCCIGSYGSAQTCQRSDYTNIAKRECPQAYSFAYDDSSSTFTCPGGSGYTITFCP